MSETETPQGELHTLDVPSEIEIRDEMRREIAVRLVPWGVVTDSRAGPEVWEPGATAGLDPARITIRLEHDGKSAGRGVSLEERSDGPVGVFRVSKTQAGDELLELAKDGVVRGVSPAYYDVPGGTDIQVRSGRRTRVIRRADIRHVALTERPTWEQSAVLSVRSLAPEVPVDTVTSTGPVIEPVQPDFSGITAAITDALQRRDEGNATAMQKILDRVAELEERSRKDVVIPSVPAPTPAKRISRVVEWMSVAVRALGGERIPAAELHQRDLDDILTPDNPGAVPDAFINDVIANIDQSRPFCSSTRQIAFPDVGMTIQVPIVSQRATAGVQDPEKEPIASQATKVTLKTFNALNIWGGADISIAMLRRSTPTTLQLILDDLASAYALECENQALAALFDAPTSPGSNDLDPEGLEIGEAWANSIANFGQPPDTIWLSSDAVAAFIDAKSDGTNVPLYFNLAASFGAGNAPAGTISALRPVYVPALNGTSVDVIIGPSAGFAWAEDGRITLQADNPGLAGRDIAIGGLFCPMPRYPTAFTTYDLGS